MEREEHDPVDAGRPDHAAQPEQQDSGFAEGQEDAVRTPQEEEIRDFVGARLSGYKKPKVVEFVAEIPKTALGKPDKKAARAPYWAGQDRMVR